jgi:putative hydrolase of the HAD superfamily
VVRSPADPSVDAAIATDRHRAVLFDAAGTLFRLRTPVGATYADAALAHGLSPRRDLAQTIEQGFQTQFPAMPRPRYRPGDLAHNQAEDRRWWRQLVQRVMQDLGPFDFDPFFDTVYSLFARGEAWELFPEVPAVLAELRRRGHRLAIVSNFDARLLPVCEGLGLRSRVDVITYAAEAGAAKPDAGIFAWALRRLEVEASAALHVGDSLAEDVEGARAAGLDALWVCREPDGLRRPPHGIAAIPDLRALIAGPETDATQTGVRPQSPTGG